MACHVVHARRQTKPPRLLRLRTGGRRAEHGLDALPRQLAPPATAPVALRTHAVAPSPRSPKRRGTRVSDGGMSQRARASVNDATTLDKAVHRWQACRARPRCASTPTGTSCDTSRRPLYSRCRTISTQPRQTWGKSKRRRQPRQTWNTSERRRHVKACTCFRERSNHA